MAYTAIGRIRFRMRGAWTSGTAYEVMDVVRNAAGTIAYVAVKDVPSGTALTNGEYWAVLADVSTLKGEKGDTGAQGEKGETGAQGAQGEKGETGSTGAAGADGVSVVMGYVDGDGHLQVTLSNGITVDAGYVKGEKGDQGQGITILGSYDSESELTSAHPTGSAGDAYLIGGSLYVWSATESAWVNVGSIQGPKGDKGDPGEDGADGAAGYIPVRGTDYWTEADKAEIKSYVDEAILGGEW